MTTAAAQPPGRAARPPAGRIVRPFQHFIATESAGGVVLLAAVCAALAWANSPWSSTYRDLIEQHLIVDLGFYRLDESLHYWINDGAMVLFFFLVGLEIKREVAVGELESVSRLVVPLCAALGGILVPVAVFLALVSGGDDARGWGIPMATGIAFVMGVLALLGPRIPTGLKVLMLTIAIVDDIGAILVIAIYYSSGIEWPAVGVAVSMLGLAGALRYAGVWYIPAYFVLGIVAWMAMVKSGVHPTLVGVAFGLLTPWRAWYQHEEFLEQAQPMLDRVSARRAQPEVNHSRRGELEELLRLGDLSRRAVSPLDRLEHDLHALGAFVVVPLFAFANAGVSLGGGVLDDALMSRITWAVALGLLVGKPVGIMLGAWVAVLAGATLPRGVRWRSLLGIAILGGIGFTVSLLIAGLSYTAEARLIQAKVGIIAASALAGLIGYLSLRYTERDYQTRTPGEPQEIADETASTC